MLRNIYKKSSAVILFLLMIFLLPSCSKNDNDALGDRLGKTSLKMKVNSEEWNSTMNLLVTEEQESGEQEKYRYVYISGQRIIKKNSSAADDLVETIGLYINIPESKFNNPKGVYPIILKETKMGHAWSIFGSSTDLRDTTTYVSGESKTPEQAVGNLEITDFKIGEQNIFGHSTGKLGYTQLSGNFYLDVYALDGTSSSLKITEGKFNISDSFDLSF